MAHPVVDEQLCAGCGTCEALCSEVFGETGVLVAYREIAAPLRNRTFYCLADLGARLGPVFEDG